MSIPYPVLDNRPINQWKVAELKEELKRRNLTVRGLKDDLIKRLDEAIRNERKASEEELINDVGVKPENVVECEDMSLNPCNLRIAEQGLDDDMPKTVKVSNDVAESDIHCSPADTEQLKVEEMKTIGETCSTRLSCGEPVLVASLEKIGEKIIVSQIVPGDEALEKNEDKDSSLFVVDTLKVEEQAMLETYVENSKVTNDIVVTQIAFGEKALERDEVKTEKTCLEALHIDAESETSDLNNQVHEVSSNLEIQVKSESIPTDIVSVIEKIELNDNSNTDNIHLELEAEKLEMVKPLILSSGGSPHDHNWQPLDDEKSPTDKEFVEQTYKHKSKHVDLGKKTDSADEISSMNAKLDHNVVNSSVKEDVEKKLIDLDDNSIEVGCKFELPDVSIAKESCHGDVGPNLSPDKMDTSAEGDNVETSAEKTAPSEEVKSKDDIGSRCVDTGSRSDMVDEGPPEKINFEPSSADDSMEEDALEMKQIDSNIKSLELAGNTGAAEFPGNLDDLRSDFSSDDKLEFCSKNKDDIAALQKRKLPDESAIGNKEPAKRQRKWNADSSKIPGKESSSLLSAEAKNLFEAAVLLSNVGQSNSTPSRDVPKERVVPPSAVPPTNSLRIDNFLRPFTLKAVQELLAKTGKVSNFWMDQIKTHCYVTYSSVDDASKTRNALYNLQWPPNGGRLLVAEFVDPQEVKSQAEAPSHSSVPPVSSSPTAPSARPPIQPPPSARQQGLRQHPLAQPAAQQPHTTPHTTSDRPRTRDRLPPPAPVEKVDSPIVTLDDLFRKTRATPRIYYLPLTDEQVALKLAKQRKSK